MAKNTTKDTIADSYLRLIEGGNGNVNVTDVIRDSGVSRQTFYYHFRGLEDLLEYVMTRVATEIEERCAKVADARTSMRIVVEGFVSNMDLLKTINESSKRDMQLRVIRDLLVTAMRRRILADTDAARKLTISELDVAVTAHAYGFLGIFIDAVEKGKTLDVDEVTDLVYRLYSGKAPLLI